jgi:hypothetical protein
LAALILSSARVATHPGKNRFQLPAHLPLRGMGL